MGAVTVYRYGVVLLFHEVVPVVVDEQLRLAHNLREELVTLERRRRERIAAVWSSDPGIAGLEERIRAAESDAETAAAQAAKERAAAGSRGPTASSARLRELRGQIKEWRGQRRDRIAVTRQRHREDLAVIAAEYQHSVKALYGCYCQDPAPGARLYWATFNDVVDHHRRAVKRIDALHAAGRPAVLRHHRFDGTGSLSVQLQRRAGVPPRSPATLADPDGRWRNVLALTPWVEPEVWEALPRTERKRRRLGTARFRCAEAQVSLPVIVHRMLPADADVTGARLVLRRIGGHRKIELHVTANVPDPPCASGPTVALHLGYRSVGDTIRAATWRVSAPVTPPDDLSAWVAAHTDRSGEVCIPARWRSRVDSHDRLNAERTIAVDTIRAELVAWLTEHGRAPRRDQADPEKPDEWVDAAAVARWRSPGRFASLALGWRDWQPALPHAAAIAAALEAWRAADRKLWEPQAHGRDGALGQRDDAYRRFAAWLTGRAGRLIIDDTVVANLARRPPPTAEPELPTAVVQRVARQRTLVAPGRLRELIVTAARARGVAVVTVPHVGVSRTHYGCGHVNPADGRYALSRIVRCDGCDRDYDQDASATLVMFAAVGEAPPAGDRVLAGDFDQHGHAGSSAPGLW